MNNLPYQVHLIITLLLVIVVGGLSFVVFDSFRERAALESTPTPTPIQQVAAPTDACSETCQEEIAKAVSEAIATISGTTTINTETIVREIPAVSHGTDFISLGSTGTTTNMVWTTIEDAAVYIDLVNDYNEKAYVTWEASLKVAHGNGTAYARLWDDTNKIAVDGSEISTVNNVNFEQKVSGDLALWRGRNLYKVQIKSLNSFEVTYGGGRIKVVE